MLAAKKASILYNINFVAAGLGILCGGIGAFMATQSLHAKGDAIEACIDSASNCTSPESPVAKNVAKVEQYKNDAQLPLVGAVSFFVLTGGFGIAARRQELKSELGTVELSTSKGD
jgi:hypothetical protein